MTEEKKGKILVVDDDKLVLRSVSEALTRDGYEVISLADPVESLSVVNDSTLDLVVTDLNMPAISGLQLLQGFKQAQPDVEVIMMTGAGTIETAIEAMRLGAFDYLSKPFGRFEEVRLRVGRAIERRRLKQRAVVAEDALTTSREFEGMIGHSARMAAVFKLVEQVGPTSATVLIRGESGTGKELIARALHYRSERRAKPFLAVNCSALTETLLESELFGHAKGAFTGAVTAKRGLFEAADGGTLFLDEIGDVSAATQVRLLRVLQEGEFKRVGATETLHVDTRVVAATNVDLEKARAEGRFREDLYYRLNVITLSVPPLRERPTDIPVLAQHFVKVYAQKLGRRVSGITSAAMKKLVMSAWPGNVRELENVIERGVVLTQTSDIDVGDLPEHLQKTVGAPVGESELLSLTHLPFPQAKALAMAAFERRYLSTMLDKSSGNISAAALASGLDRSNFRRQMKAAGLAAE